MRVLSSGVRSRALSVLAGGLLVAMSALCVSPALSAAPDVPSAVASKLVDGSDLSKLWAEPGARMPVIVQFAPPELAAPASFDSPAAADAAQTRAVHAIQDQILGAVFGSSSLDGPAAETLAVKRMDFSPMFGISVTADELASLAANPQVLRIQEDGLSELYLDQAVPLVGMADAYAAGATGQGKAVAVLDSGTRSTHEFFAGKIVSAACYGTTNNSFPSLSYCPGGVAESTAIDSANDCDPAAISGCGHGTHVSGIASGNNGNRQAGEPANGVARNGSLITINVFSRFTTQNNCGSSPAPCILSFNTDQILGLERVFALRNTFSIASVNMSLGGGQFFSACDSDARKPIIDQLRAANIATVIAAGNSGFDSSVGAPGCISSAITVASSTKSDVRSSFSNWGNLIDVAAPGSQILASYVSGDSNTFYDTLSGTSMASPMVAGVWAAIRTARPNATVDQIEAALESTGLGISSAGFTKPRIRVDQALAALGAVNTITFPALPNTAFTSTPPVPAASASSGLAISYASTTTPVCTTTNVGVISFVAAGTCSITASQAGNVNFVAATPVTRSFSVTAGVNTILFPVLPNTAFTSTPPVPAASASSGLAVSYASTTAPVCTATNLGVISLVAAGTCSITASQAGNANFAAATPVTRSFSVTPGVNVVTFPALPNTAFTSTPPVPAASASSGLAVSYASTTAPVCTATNLGVISLVAAGTCSITASQAGNANFAAATPVTRSFSVTPAASTTALTTSGSPSTFGSSVTFTATVSASGGGTPSGSVTFKVGAATLGVGTLSGGTATFATAALGVGAHPITATYGGSTIHAASASVIVTQTVDKGTSVTTLTAAASPVQPGQNVTLQATVVAAPGGSGTPTGSVVFRNGAAVLGTVPLAGGSASLSTTALPAGGHSLTASYGGNASFLASASQARLLTVERSCSDAFASATIITGKSGVASGSTATATGESGEPNHAGGTGPLNSVWCRWTAPATGRVTFDTTGSLFNTKLAVYTGSVVSQLTQIAANDNIAPTTTQSRVTFTAQQGTIYRIAVDGAGAAVGNYALNWTQEPSASTLFASVLPTSRSVLTGSTATAFATVINGGSARANQCAVSLPSGFPATFFFQTTTSANVPSGQVNVPVDIQPGAAQSFIFGITPTAQLNAAEVALVFSCNNSQPAQGVPGLNTLTLSASATPTADILAIVSTLSNDGIVSVPLPGTGLFATAAVNIGAASNVNVSVDDGGNNLPLSITLCRTNPTTGFCLSPPVAVQSFAFGSGEVATLTVFLQATAPVPFSPGVNRLQLRVKTDDGVTRGSTSVAVRTQ